MNDTKCNGWANKETWNIDLRYEAVFTEMAEEQEWDDVDCLADAMEAVVVVNELDYDTLDVKSFAKEVVGEYLERVDWVEIAEKYFVGSISEEDEDKIEQIVDSLSEK